MFKNKYGILVVSGIGLLAVGGPQIPLEMSLDSRAIFSMVWLLLVHLTIVANWRRLTQSDLREQHREEAQRRRQWLEVEQQSRHVRSRQRQSKTPIKLYKQI
ncbi:hypothetical protein [Hazenella coriacea]|uniref:Uncharacterized protein n=1 Tax=Hazenella coriacea TaxID=1179467 RepID=A0A4R3LAM7_9BACL|nr:hypothetical protein [Hazenella coriacea]TCS96762.1 hypothetical protein EDD58_101403 [Hazenella coriacea]